MKKDWILLLGLCCLCITQACSSENDLIPDTEKPGNNGYENVNPIIGEEDLQIAVVKASGTVKGSISVDPEKLKLSYDNDHTTLYRDNMGKEDPATYLYEFKGDEIIDYCLYYPYPLEGGYYGAWGRVEVYIRETGGTSKDFVKVGEKDLGYANITTTFTFEGQKRIDAVKFVVHSGEQNFASCAEMKFFRRATPAFDPFSLFKDATCSELKEGIAQCDIDACTDAFYKTMAQAMMDGTYPTEFRIQEFSARPNPAGHQEKNLINEFSSFENVTGISVKAKEKLTVFVGDIPSGQSLSLKVTDWNDKDGAIYQGSYPLLSGFNQIEMNDKGLVYLLYQSPEWQNLPKVKVHFATGTVNGYFDTGKHNKKQWKDIIGKAQFELFDVIGKRSQVTFKTEHFKSACTDPIALMEVYDEIMELGEKFTGMQKYGREIPNRMYVHYINGSGGAMSAAEGHINWNNPDKTAVIAEEVRKSPWGIAHELGHELQLRPGRQRYEGMLEVTNNLVAIYVQRQFGNASRLFGDNITSPKTGHRSEFERAMTYYQAEKRTHNYNMAGTRTVLTKLIPLYQLYLYCDEVLGEDWFKDYYQELLTQEYVGDNGEAQMQVIRIFCDLSRKNLLQFFEKSGFLTATDAPTDTDGKKFNVTTDMIREVKFYVNGKGYPEPEVEIWRLTDQPDCIKAFKDRAGVTKGTCRRSDRTFTMTGWKNVAAYEVYNGNQLIYVSPHDEFTIPESYNLNGSIVIRAVSATGNITGVSIQ